MMFALHLNTLLTRQNFHVTNGLKKLMQSNVFTVGSNLDELKPL